MRQPQYHRFVQQHCRHFGRGTRGRLIFRTYTPVGYTKPFKPVPRSPTAPSARDWRTSVQRLRRSLCRCRLPMSRLAREEISASRALCCTPGWKQQLVGTGADTDSGHGMCALPPNIRQAFVPSDYWRAAHHAPEPGGEISANSAMKRMWELLAHIGPASRDDRAVEYCCCSGLQPCKG